MVARPIVVMAGKGTLGIRRAAASHQSEGRFCDECPDALAGRKAPRGEEENAGSKTSEMAVLAALRLDKKNQR